MMNQSINQEVEDADRQIEVNLQKVLRQDVMHVTSHGIVLATQRSHQFEGFAPMSPDYNDVTELNLVFPSNNKDQQRRRRASQPTIEATGRKGYGFTEYAPAVFAALRAQWGMDSETYLKSFGKLKDGQWIPAEMKESISSGRSGAFFYFSFDKKFIVKTMTTSELATLRKILPQYYQYMTRHPHSLLTRFYGCLDVRVYTKHVHLMVIDNLFAQCHIETVYDLKGSWVNRQTLNSPNKNRNSGKSDERGSTYTNITVTPATNNSSYNKAGERRTRNELVGETAEETADDAMEYSNNNNENGSDTGSYSSKNPTHLSVTGQGDGGSSSAPKAKRPVLKDLDFENNKERLAIPQEIALDLQEQLRLDSEFLSKCGLMDYSLLLGIHQPRSDPHRTPPRSPTAYPDTMNLVIEPSAPSRFNRAQNSRTSLVHSSRRVAIQTLPECRFRQSQGGVEGQCGVVYCMGVIDVLQEWNMSKRGERFFKTFMLRKNKEGLSAISPQPYSERFVRCLRKVLSETPADRTSATTLSPLDIPL
eukprot:c18420_g1_i2.p1 GENE.c18420_g1_i2~~c18420_g1_i2.p1  ORF type:complete len:533 (+),score=125.92 c18420_g1_i2:39-1637(+)